MNKKKKEENDEIEQWKKTMGKEKHKEVHPFSDGDRNSNKKGYSAVPALSQSTMKVFNVFCLQKNSVLGNSGVFQRQTLPSENDRSIVLTASWIAFQAESLAQMSRMRMDVHKFERWSNLYWKQPLMVTFRTNPQPVPLSLTACTQIDWGRTWVRHQGAFTCILCENENSISGTTPLCFEPTKIYEKHHRQNIWDYGDLALAF